MSLRPSSRTEVRRNRYKVTVDAVKGRWKREDHMVETLQKKRRKVMSDAPQTGEDLPSEKKFLEMVGGMWSEDMNLQLEMTTLLVKLLSTDRNPPLNDVIQSGLVPRLVTFLSRVDFPKLQFEAALALANLAAGTSENTNVIVESGAIPILIQLLCSATEEVCEQAVWALGNLAGDSPKCRDFILSFDAMEALLFQFHRDTKLSMLRNATWALSNFCRGKPQPSLEQTNPALPFLKILVQSTDVEVLTNACWALEYLSDNPNENIQAVIDAGVVPRIIELLAHTSPAVLIPALRTIGNIVSGDDVQTQMVVDHKVLPFLLDLITKMHTMSIKKEACWIISNITAGSSDRIQAAIDAGIIQALVGVLLNAEFEVKKEAAFAISTATTWGTHDQIKFMVSHGCIGPICDLLTCPDPITLRFCLEAVHNILKVGEALKSSGLIGDVNHYVTLVEDAEGLEKIESLHDIYKRSLQILQNFWAEEDDVEEGIQQQEIRANVDRDIPDGDMK